MSYLLVGAEILALAMMLISATALPPGDAAPSRRGAWLAAGAAALFLVPLLGLCALTAYLQFVARSATHWFAFSLTLLAMCIGGMTLAWRRVRARRWTPSPAHLVAAMLMTAVLLGLTVWNMELAAQARIASIRLEAGAELLSVSPAMVADQNNAATFYQKAFERIKSDGLDKDPILQMQEDADPRSPAVKAFLSRAGPCMDELRRGAALTDLRWSRDYARPSITMLLPELGALRIGAKMLQLDARVALSAGDTKSAVDDIRCIYAMGRQESEEPILISLLVAWGIDRLADSALESALPLITDSKLLDTLQLPDSGAARRALLRALHGENAFGLASVADFADGDIDPSLLAGLDGNASTTTRLTYSTLPVYRICYLGDDVAGYSRLMSQYRDIVVMDSPYSQTRPRIEALQSDLRSRPYGTFSPLMAPALNSIYMRSRREEALEALARVAIAVSRYRLDHHALPALDALVPAYLDQLPTDPFDGKPLRVKRDGSRLTLYSVGPDLHDDGGAAGSDSQQTGDIGFHLNFAD